MTIREGGHITILALSRVQRIVGPLGLEQEEWTAKPQFFRMNSIYPQVTDMKLGGGLVELALELWGEEHRFRSQREVEQHEGLGSTTSYEMKLGQFSL